ncbi:unnamed protein product, partial [Rotaria socialis]
MPFERHAWFRNRYTEPSIVLHNSHKSYIWLWKLSVVLKYMGIIHLIQLFYSFNAYINRTRMNIQWKLKYLVEMLLF